MPPHTGRIYDCTDPMGIIVRDTSLDIREESIYGLLGTAALESSQGKASSHPGIRHSAKSAPSKPGVAGSSPAGRSATRPGRTIPDSPRQSTAS